MSTSASIALFLHEDIYPLTYHGPGRTLNARGAEHVNVKAESGALACLARTKIRSLRYLGSLLGVLTIRGSLLFGNQNWGAPYFRKPPFECARSCSTWRLPEGYCCGLAKILPSSLRDPPESFLKGSSCDDAFLKARAVGGCRRNTPQPCHAPSHLSSSAKSHCTCTKYST